MFIEITELENVYDPSRGRTYYLIGQISTNMLSLRDNYGLEFQKQSFLKSNEKYLPQSDLSEVKCL